MQYRDDAANSPSQKYFSEGRGKELREQHGIWLHPNPNHGSAPHIHMELSESRGEIGRAHV